MGTIIELIKYDFFVNAFLASLLAAISCGIVGTYIVSRRIVFISGGITHASFGGIGMGYYLGINPLIGAGIFSVLSGMGIQLFSSKGKVREDSSIAIWWSLGMAIGIIFVYLTPGYAPNLMSYLFGSILLITQTDLLWMVLMDGAIIATILICYNRFLAIAFNEELARLRGVPTLRYELIYHVLTALTVVLLVRMTGIVLAIALLTLPAATAGKLVTRLDAMMLLGVVLSFGVSVLGLAISYTPGWPPGATIVEVALILYGLSASITFLKRRTRGSV